MGWREAAGVAPSNDWRKAAGISPKPEPEWFSPESASGTALRGTGQGASLGFSDELRGVTGAADELGARMAGAVGWESRGLEQTRPSQGLLDALKGRYAEDSGAARKEEHQAQQANPMLYGATEIAGSLVLPIPGGATAKGIGLGTKVLRGAGTAALLGGAYGAGKSEATDAGGVLRDAAVTGGMTAPLGAAGTLVGSGASKLGERFGGYLRGKAGESAANAAGLRSGIVNQAKRAGIGSDEIADLGNEMLDAKLIPLLGNKAGVLERANALKNASGSAQQAVLQRAEASGRPFDYADASSAAANKLKGITTVEERASGRARDFVGDVLEQGNRTPGSFLGAQDLKSKAYGTVNWNTEAPLAADLHRQAAKGLRESIENQVTNAIGSHEADALRAANKSYGLGAKTAAFAKEAAEREAGQGKLGWGSLLLSATGAGAGANFGTVAAGAGAMLPIIAHIGKTRGSAMAAHSMRALSNALEYGSPKIGEVLGKYGPLLAIQPTLEGKHAVINKALEEDPEAAQRLEQLLAEPMSPEPTSNPLTRYFGG